MDGELFMEESVIIVWYQWCHKLQKLFCWSQIVEGLIQTAPCVLQIFAGIYPRTQNKVHRGGFCLTN